MDGDVSDLTPFSSTPGGAWRSLGPHEPKPTWGRGWFAVGNAAEGIAGYEVNGDWRRLDGRWIRCYRAVYRDGRTEVGWMISPLRSLVYSEDYWKGPFLISYPFGWALAVATAAGLVATGATGPLTAMAGCAVGIAGVTAAWSGVVQGRAVPAALRRESPGNPVWRLTPRLLETGMSLLCFMPAGVTVVAAIALAQLESHVSRGALRDG